MASNKTLSMNFLNFLLTPRVRGKFCPLRNDNSTAQKSMSCISYEVKISYDDWTHVMVSDDDITRILIILEFEFLLLQVDVPSVTELSPP